MGENKLKLLLTNVDSNIFRAGYFEINNEKDDKKQKDNEVEDVSNERESGIIRSAVQFPVVDLKDHKIDTKNIHNMKSTMLSHRRQKARKPKRT